MFWKQWIIVLLTILSTITLVECKRKSRRLKWKMTKNIPIYRNKWIKSTCGFRSSSLFSLNRMEMSKLEERTFVFAFSGDGYPSNFVENGKLVGQSVNLVHEVCRVAGRKCETTLIPRAHCWNTKKNTYPAMSKALNGRWFDVCANLPCSAERKLNYLCPKLDFFNTPDPVLIVRPGSNITVKSLLECNTLRLAYAGNLGLRPDCILTSRLWFDQKYFIEFPTTSDIGTVTKELEYAVMNNKTDVALVVTNFLPRDSPVEILIPVPCSTQLRMGLSVMVRKDDASIIDWWQDALEEFICDKTHNYGNFCKEQLDIFGRHAGCRIPGIDVDCTKYGGPGLLPKTETIGPARNKPCDPDFVMDIPDCGMLKPVDNGSIDNTGTSLGTVVTYDCNTGHHLVGLNPVVCGLDGKWIPEAPVCDLNDCGPPSAPVNGSVSSPVTTYGSTATFACDTGYELSDSDASLLCDIDGNWQGEIPQCEEIEQEDIVFIRPDCAFKKIRDFDDWRVTACPHRETSLNLPFTDCLEHACDTDNYNAMNYNTGNCNFKQCDEPVTEETAELKPWGHQFQVWIRLPTDYDCQESQDCPFYDIDHAILEPVECAEACSDNPACVAYVISPQGGCWLKSLCDDTQLIVNTQRITCFKRTIECGSASPILNGQTYLPVPPTYGSNATFTCNNGYELSDDTKFLTCDENGDWTGESPECNAIECGSASPILNGQTSWPVPPTYGSNATFTCNNGYELSDDTKFLTCDENGDWTGESPECNAIECGSASPILNGQTSWPVPPTYGSNATFTCNNGYELSDDTKFLTCDENGDWTGESPECNAIECGSASPILNGQTSWPVPPTYGSNATFTCNNGYELSDDTKFLTCDENGDWTGESPECNVLGSDCGQPPAILNGRTSWAETSEGSQATFMCNEGYQISDETASLTCDENGIWVGVSPECIESTCQITVGAEVQIETFGTDSDTYSCQHILEQEVYSQSYDFSASVHCDGNHDCKAGLVFNWQDENNYDFMYLRDHPNFCFVYGWLLNGITWSTSSLNAVCSDVNVMSGNWIKLQLSLSVKDNKVKARAYIDGHSTGTWQPHFSSGKTGAGVINDKIEAVQYKDFVLIQDTCTPVSTTSGENCVFPFTLGATKYTQCTSADRENDGSPDAAWCATDRGYGVTNNQWSECIITTTGGTNVVPSICHFPFIWLGVARNACIRENHHSFWCYVDNNGIPSPYWGNCELATSDCSKQIAPITGYELRIGLTCSGIVNFANGNTDQMSTVAECEEFCKHNSIDPILHGGFLYQPQNNNACDCIVAGCLDFTMEDNVYLYLKTIL